MQRKAPKPEHLALYGDMKQVILNHFNNVSQHEVNALLAQLLGGSIVNAALMDPTQPTIEALIKAAVRNIQQGVEAGLVAAESLANQGKDN